MLLCAQHMWSMTWTPSRYVKFLSTAYGANERYWSFDRAFVMRGLYALMASVSQIGMAQTKFNTTESNIVEINSNPSASLSISGATVATPATLPPGSKNTASTTYSFGTIHTGLGPISGVPTNLAVSTFNPARVSVTTTATATPSSGGAPPLASSGSSESLLMLCTVVALIATSGVLSAWRR